MSITDKYIRSLAVLAHTQGWEVDDTGKHVHFLSPTNTLVVTPKTPSDHRGLLNTASDLRRAGLIIPRKAPRKKEMIHSAFAQQVCRAADDFELDVTLDEWPFVTQAIGSWREASWFSDEGLPLSENQWTGPDLKMMTQAIMVVNQSELDLIDGALKVSQKRGAVLQPSSKNKRIWVDSLRFWAAWGPPPSECGCGFRPTASRSKYDNMFVLAEHFYNRVERGGEEDHYPSGMLPWMDPAELVDLAEADQTDRIVELEQQLAEARGQRDTARDKLRDLCLNLERMSKGYRE